MFPVRTILHPTDFSECSRFAFETAVAHARAHGARLVVLHAYQPPGPLPAYGEDWAWLQPADDRDALWQSLSRLQVADPAVKVEHRLAEGPPAQEILRAAEEVGCDLIVMGTRGRSGLERLIFGSVAEQVLRKAGCPVITVKVPSTDAVALVSRGAGAPRRAKAASN